MLSRGYRKPNTKMPTAGPTTSGGLEQLAPGAGAAPPGSRGGVQIGTPGGGIAPAGPTPAMLQQIQQVAATQGPDAAHALVGQLAGPQVGAAVKQAMPAAAAQQGGAGGGVGAGLPPDLASRVQAIQGAKGGPPTDASGGASSMGPGGGGTVSSMPRTAAPGGPDMAGAGTNPGASPNLPVSPELAAMRDARTAAFTAGGGGGANPAVPNGPSGGTFGGPNNIGLNVPSPWGGGGGGLQPAPDAMRQALVARLGQMKPMPMPPQQPVTPQGRPGGGPQAM